MSTETPNFNTKKLIQEKESARTQFLREQIRLSKDQWSEEFHKLVEEKTEQASRENQEREAWIRGEREEESPEKERQHTFLRYLDELGLTEADLRGKKVLDLGFGTGEFVKHLIAKGITYKAYGVDVTPFKDSIEEGFEDHLLQGNFEDELPLPVQNLDYVVSIRAIWPGDDGEEIMDIKRIIEKSLSSLKEGGEIRIYPIEESAQASPDKETESVRLKWGELLTEISKADGVKCRIEARDIWINESNNHIFLKSVLIISKENTNA